MGHIGSVAQPVLSYRSFRYGPGCVLLAMSMLLFGYTPEIDAEEADRYALLVGVTNYDKPELNTGLKFPETDANELAKVFRSQGYTVDVLVGRDATLKAIRERLASFSKRGGNGGVVFVSLCGHGIEFEDSKQSFFCPYDAEMRTTRDADGKVLFDEQGRPTQSMNPDSLISIDEVLIALGDSKASNRILVADCCRNDPNRARGRSFGSSLTTQKLPLKTLLLLSCSAQERSYEHDHWNHGALTKCLLAELRGVPRSQKTMGNVAEDVLPAVGKLVRATIGDREIQTPRMLSTGRVELLFDKVHVPTDEATSSSLPKELVNSLGMQMKLIRPGEFLMGSQHSTDALKKLGFTVEFDSNDDELPQHRVAITKPFYMGAHEVTLGQFLHYYNADRENHRTDAERDGKGGSGIDLAVGEWADQQANYVPWNTGWNKPVEDFMNHPVVNVSWGDALEFCRWLTEKDRKTGKLDPEFEYLLPTEAQWEFACRGGSQVPRIFHFGNDPRLLPHFSNIGDKSAKLFFDKRNIGWSNYHPGEDGFVFTAPVGSYEPNNYGLHDMHGNIQEWCLDGYDRSAYTTRSKGRIETVLDPFELNGIYRVLRGGAWNDNEWNRTADRRWTEPWNRWESLGFRVAIVRVDSIDAEKRIMLECFRLATRGLDTLKSLPPSSSQAFRQTVAVLSFRLHITRDPDGPMTIDKIQSILDEMQGDPGLLNQIVWDVVQWMEGRKSKDKAILKLCESYLGKAIVVETTPSLKANATDTIAHLQFLQDRVDDAIATQKSAIALADETDKPILRANLEKFEDASTRNGRNAVETRK
jgi:sulfatase modifying factor 1